MTICDLKNDNYYKLIAAEIPNSIDMKPKLKVKADPEPVKKLQIFANGLFRVVF